jgi:hypothetical protein
MDDVVVEVVVAGVRGDGEKLGSGRMHQNLAQGTDFGLNIDGHAEG